MPRRLTFDSIAQLPERYRQQAIAQLAPKTATKAQPPSGRATVFRACPHERCRTGGAGCVERRDFTLTFPGRALTTNRLISALFIRDPEVRAARTAEVGRTYKEWKAAAFAQAVHDRIPTLATAVIEVQALYVGRLPDAGGLTMVGKAVVDGLVEAGVFVDDGPAVVLGEWYPAPRRDPSGDRVEVTIGAGRERPHGTAS